MSAADHVVGDLDYGSATLSNGRVTVLPDRKGGASATDEVGSNGPTTSPVNGSTIATFAGSQHLSWPLQSGVNGRTNAQGFAFWYRPRTTNPGTRYFEPFSAWIETSAKRFNITQDRADLQIYGGPGDPSWVRSVPSFFVADTWVFVYVHFQGSEVGNDRLKVFSVAADGAFTSHELAQSQDNIGATLPQAEGNLLIGAYNTDDTDSLDGDMGQHVWALDEPLTDQEILELAAIDAPVVLGLATGSPSTTAATGSGTATRTVDLEASGSPSIEPAIGSGAAVRVVDARGAPAAGAATGSGTAARVNKASGAPSIEPATGSGTAVRVRPVATTPAVEAAGAALTERDARGVATVPAVTATGAAVRVLAVRAELTVATTLTATVTAATALSARVTATTTRGD